MLPIAIHADRAFTPFEEISDAVVVIHGSKISAVGLRAKCKLAEVLGTLRSSSLTRDFHLRESLPLKSWEFTLRVRSSAMLGGECIRPSGLPLLRPRYCYGFWTKRAARGKS